MLWNIPDNIHICFYDNLFIVDSDNGTSDNSEKAYFNVWTGGVEVKASMPIMTRICIDLANFVLMFPFTLMFYGI